MVVSFVLFFFPRDVLNEILNLIESFSEGFPSYSCTHFALSGQLICHLSTYLKDYFFETTGPISIKFHMQLSGQRGNEGTYIWCMPDDQDVCNAHI